MNTEHGRYIAVIGKNFGDEGKGLCVDWLADTKGPCLVCRHNGGAQAGHTVELPDGRRFVFHELSSGSFRMADTFWADSFYPDLYKLSEECRSFAGVNDGKVPKIFAHADACTTLIDDVFLNMGLETARGDARHGSCGMGIWEAVLRSKAGYSVSVRDWFELSPEELTEKLKRVRIEYLPVRLAELGMTLDEMGEFSELLENDTVLDNFVAVCKRNLRFITPVNDVKTLFDRYERVIFETGQGLLLDEKNEEYFPNVSASRTGLYHPVRILNGISQTLSEAVYVTRSYVTRHGAGKLPGEVTQRTLLGEVGTDETNRPNLWQGSIRYAFHPSLAEFAGPVRRDWEENAMTSATTCSLLVTHLNETNERILSADNAYYLNSFEKELEKFISFDRIYKTSSKFSEEIRESEKS